MQIRLHKNATTTPAQREFIQKNPHLSTACLAEKTGVSKTTVRRWRNRSNVYDRPHTPKRIKTAITPVEEVAIILCRMATRAGLDDLHKIVGSLLGITCSRASLNRCLKRYHISKRSSLNNSIPFDLKDYTGTYFYYNCFHLPDLSGPDSPVFFHTLLDCSFRVFHATQSLSGPDFLNRHIRDFPLKVLGIIHEDPVVLSPKEGRRIKQDHAQMVESLCRSSNLVSHHLDTQYPEALQKLTETCTTLQKAPKYQSWDFPWASGTGFAEHISRYNTGLTLGALKQKTPHQVLESHYTHFPGSFRQKPQAAVMSL